eukprot:TRINITY_DN22823_c0_g2_i1.p1 TRINITY_DN22823_c0_g2~~TRINITY_DN22823_c0_g2_i1.p1  ORF type:complete len:150 (-),score=27.56 TRINITY_DN22823_c0_g2_i1:50-499(-)
MMDRTALLKFALLQFLVLLGTAEGIKLFKSQLSADTETAARCCNETDSITCLAAKLCPSAFMYPSLTLNSDLFNNTEVQLKYRERDEEEGVIFYEFGNTVFYVDAIIDTDNWQATGTIYNAVNDDLLKFKVCQGRIYRFESSVKKEDVK